MWEVDNEIIKFTFQTIGVQRIEVLIHQDNIAP